MPTASVLNIMTILVLCMWAGRPLQVSTTVTKPVQMHRLDPVRELKKPPPEPPGPHVNITKIHVPPKCIQIQCKFICFNGKSEEIAQDIDEVASLNEITCPIFDEVRLYKYKFAKHTISPGFLHTYADKVRAIYIASSAITDIEAGAFSNGVFKQIFLEDLQLHTLKKEFFEGIPSDFCELSIIQKNSPVESICPTFLDHVKYQIRSLTLQVGTTCVRNMTGASNLLNNLAFVDFSFNDFGNGFRTDTFNKLSMVEHLDLSYSRISHLPDYIFSELTSTLEFLDLSHNHLVTISKTIFGWQDIPDLLKIEADENPWNCTCALSEQMKEIFVHQSAKIFCASPPKYKQWSVFDARLCHGEAEPTPSTGSALATITTKAITTTVPLTTCLDCNSGSLSTTEIIVKPPPHPPVPPVATTSVGATTSTTPLPEDTVLVQCVSTMNKSDSSWRTVEWPPLQFRLMAQPQLRVAITIETGTLNESYGLLWFSKVTSEYYKMEVNYNEYGLGCCSSIAHTTTVANLLPDTAYTFCLVLKDQLTISPFSCESIRVGGNVGVTAWLTRDMRAKGISLAVLGIVIFAFVGICVVFLLLKRRPILLKGSKRVATTSSSSTDIVVFPRDTILEGFKLKEQMLSKRSSGSASTPIIRRGSVESVVSYQSYMNANLYEMIPAYLKLQDPNLFYEKVPPCLLSEANDCYLPPLACNKDEVIYAEVPYRTKRISSDPLPELPQRAPHTEESVIVDSRV